MTIKLLHNAIDRRTILFKWLHKEPFYFEKGYLDCKKVRKRWFFKNLWLNGEPLFLRVYLCFPVCYQIIFSSQTLFRRDEFLTNIQSIALDDISFHNCEKDYQAPGGEASLNTANLSLYPKQLYLKYYKRMETRCLMTSHVSGIKYRNIYKKVIIFEVWESFV